MSHIDFSHVTFTLPDGRVLLNDVTFRIPAGAVAALVGPNGAGKTTLLRITAGDLVPDEGQVIYTGHLAIMWQFTGHMTEGTLRDLLLQVSPPVLREVATAVDEAGLALMDDDSERNQMRYAQTLADFADAGGYDAEVLWDFVTTSAIGKSYESVKNRKVSSFSGGEQKRIVLEYLLRDKSEVLILDEPDNYLDVPGKIWLEKQLQETSKTVMLISHDRELLSNAATHIVSLELVLQEIPHGFMVEVSETSRPPV